MTSCLGSKSPLEKCPCDTKEEDTELNEIVDGIDLDRLREICAAERDGRVAIEKCKVGDLVTAKVLRPYNGHELTIHGEVVDIETVFRVKHSSCRYVDFLMDDFGKTVFLTHKEAEAALKGASNA
jgi:hypothetical protein